VPDSSPERRCNTPSELSIHQQLVALRQTCEMLQLRMHEFEQVLLELDQRVVRLQASGPKARRSHQPVARPHSPRPRRRPRHRNSYRWPRLVLLLMLVLAGASLLMSRYTATTTKREPHPSHLSDPNLPLELQLRARGSTWLEVQTASGKPLHYGMMQPGILRFPIQEMLRVRAGRPDLVEVLFRGRTYILGKVNELDWKQFNAN
jgi:hypothetical protein